MQWLLTSKVWLLNTRKVIIAHFFKKSGYSPFQLQALEFMYPDFSSKSGAEPCKALGDLTWNDTAVMKVALMKPSMFYF